MKNRQISAIIFDLDGLVLDTESTYKIAWQQAAQEMGYSFNEHFMQSLSGLHYNDLVLKLLNYCGQDFNLVEFNQKSSIYWHDYVASNRIKINHGFHDLLDAIQKKQIPFALATNSQRHNAKHCLQLAGLENTFSILISRDDVTHGKPAPDIFLKTAEKLAIPISQCLVLEDSLIGITAAHKAGAIPILISSVAVIEPATEKMCHSVFNDLTEVLNLIN